MAVNLITFRVPVTDLVPDEAGEVEIVIQDDVLTMLTQIMSHGVAAIAKTDPMWFTIRASVQAFLTLAILPNIARAQHEGYLADVEPPNLRSNEAKQDGFVYSMRIVGQVLNSLIADQHLRGLWQKEGDALALVGCVPAPPAPGTAGSSVTAPGGVATSDTAVARSDSSDLARPLVDIGDERVGQDAIQQGTDTPASTNLADCTPVHSG